jgi:hypothetical protein
MMWRPFRDRGAWTRDSDLEKPNLASPTGFEAPDPVEPSSQPVYQTRKGNDLREEPDDGNRRE